MKPIIFLLVICCLVLQACIKENTPSTPLDNTLDTLTAVRLSSGNFINGPYGMVTGKAHIYKQDDRFILALENIQSSNGPDLHVYLSREEQPQNFIDLGYLQSTSGNQLYTINGEPDFRIYRYALIHCKRFNHLFGSARLQ